MREVQGIEYNVPNEALKSLRNVLLVGTLATTLCASITSANAEATTPPNTGGCYADGCEGLNPVGFCDGDAKTVASVAVIRGGSYEGQLDLRYSPSCKSNWARFSLASGMRNSLRTALGGPRPHGGRVTVWNPGRIS